MIAEFDAIIVGSGPAGVSAAFPLVRAGLKVLMVDGAHQAKTAPPARPFVQARVDDEDQARWMVGENFHALRMRDTVSPKLRAPSHAHVFENFRQANRIETENFIALGSLAPGGLSNAWGCGVAQLRGDSLADFPVDHADLAHSYREIVERIGISGPRQDDLSEYFGLDAELQPEIALDMQHQAIYRKYQGRRARLAAQGFRLGRFPLAALSQDKGDRKGCDLSGNCLFGCARRSLYSATEDLQALKAHHNFHHAALVVDDLVAAAGGWLVRGVEPGTGQARSLRARRVFLAAGTIVSTRLALNLLQHDQPVRLLSSPTAAFVLWLPSFLGARRVAAFGSSQLAFVLQLRADVSALGSTFSTTGLPMTEFGRHMPLRRRYTVDVLRSLMSSCVVGNMFLPGHLSNNTARRTAAGGLHITGGHHGDLPALLAQAQKRLRKAYASMGAYMLPMSFTPGQAGGDIHYAATLPMRAQPQAGETYPTGELAGAPGMFVVDGASLPALSEKSHTLTIMANADRIARQALKHFQDQSSHRNPS